MPEIKERLQKALDSDGYLITISYVDKSKQPNDLRHFWVTNNYPKNALLRSMQYMQNEIYDKEIVNSEPKAGLAHAPEGK